jgi:hypothetical protein
MKSVKVSNLTLQSKYRLGARNNIIGPVYVYEDFTETESFNWMSRYLNSRADSVRTAVYMFQVQATRDK